jgi:outer membrane protein OmpA-like peptidoglycan-associated protein
MVSIKTLALATTLTLAFACSKSAVNEIDDNFDEPVPTIEEVGITDIPVNTDFASLKSAQSLSNQGFIPDRVGFDFDSSALSNSQKQILDAQIDFIQSNISDITKIRISGYCDERGTIDYNYALGSKRANAVLNYFKSRGINTQMIETVSYGKEVVLVQGRTPEAFAENRVAKVTLCTTGNCQ